MPRAIKPTEIPALPEGMVEWRRSLRQGSMYHAHVLGLSACRSIRFDIFRSEPPTSLGDMKYWGVCPRCFANGQKKETTSG